MELTTWYYTLSTISQTLAAILGLVAVFVVLRLQGLIKNIGDYKGRAIDILKAKKSHIASYDIPQSISMGEILNDLGEIINNYENEFSKNSGFIGQINKLSYSYEPLKALNNKDFLKDTFENISSLVSQRDGVIKLVKWPGIIMSLAITTSIILLGLTDKIIDNPMPFLLLFIVAFALFGIWSTIRACWKIILAIKIFD